MSGGICRGCRHYAVLTITVVDSTDVGVYISVVIGVNPGGAGGEEHRTVVSLDRARALMPSPVANNSHVLRVERACSVPLSPVLIPPPQVPLLLLSSAPLLLVSVLGEGCGRELQHFVR